LIHGGVRYLAEAFEISFKGISERREKLALVKEALKERSYFVDNAYYLNKFIPITIPCENIFEMAYYYSGVLFLI
jgi:glycerol-3-phosphate dehydrogenase